jgi:hypothetical protein
MPTTRSSETVTQSLIELAWSLWGELGVSGWSRHHADWNVDIEALIILTAALGDADPRLRDESIDWCIRYARFVSSARLRTLLRMSDEPTRRAFDEYAATVREHTAVNWPAAGPGRPYRPTGRSQLDTLDRPSCFSLRQRALFGTGARAEIVRLLASKPDQRLSTAELADAAGFTTRAVEQELDSLVQAGLVRRTALHRRRTVQIADPDVLLPFVGSRPRWLPAWPPIVRVLLGGLHLLIRVESLPEIVKAVEARKLLTEIGPDIERADLAAPGRGAVGVVVWKEIEAWLLHISAALAAGDASVLRAGS